MNSCAPFSPPLSLFLHPPSSPPSLPLSSALAQDHINIPLKPVSTAARSPSLPLSLFLSLFLFPPFLPLALSVSFPCYCFLEGIAFLHHFYEPVQQGGAVLLPSVRSSPCCTHAHTQTCMHTHSHTSRGGGYRCL